MQIVDSAFDPMTFPESLRVLRSQSLPALVLEELERMILDGRLPPGEPLREVALAALLGVSRGPVREAFRALEEKGLARVVKNRGVFVRTLYLEEADQIYDVRIRLESLIGEQVATRIDAAGLAELSVLVQEMRSAVSSGAVSRYSALNFAFHDRLASLSGNRKLHETYGRLVAELSLFRRQTHLHDERAVDTSLREHERILAAIEGRDPVRAARLLEHHVADSRARLHQALDGARQANLPQAEPELREAGR